MKPVAVVKLGGNAINNGALLEDIAQDLGKLRTEGFDVVLVHGGGPQINKALADEGIATVKIDGLRVTSANAIVTISNTLDGVVRPQLVQLLEAAGVKAIGRSGADNNLLVATLHSNAKLERVGEVITAVNTDLLKQDFVSSAIPVISTLGVDQYDEALNINADTAAAGIAAALKAEVLILLTDVDGIYVDYPHNPKLLNDPSVEELEALTPTMSEGMMPKMQACLDAIRGGVASVFVINGNVPHAVDAAMTGQQIGTKVVSDVERKGHSATSAGVDGNLRGTHTGAGVR